jgi:hypothetical protein
VIVELHYLGHHQPNDLISHVLLGTFDLANDWRS